MDLGIAQLLLIVFFCPPVVLFVIVLIVAVCCCMEPEPEWSCFKTAQTTTTELTNIEAQYTAPIVSDPAEKPEIHQQMVNDDDQEYAYASTGNEIRIPAGMEEGNLHAYTNVDMDGRTGMMHVRAVQNAKHKRAIKKLANTTGSQDDEDDDLEYPPTQPVRVQNMPNKTGSQDDEGDDLEYEYAYTQPGRAPGSPHPGGPQPRSPNNVNNTLAGSGVGGQGKIDHDYFDSKNTPNKTGSQDDEGDDLEYAYAHTQPVRAPGSPHPGEPQPRSPNNVNNTSAGSGAGGQGKIEHDYFDPKNMPNKSGSQDDEDDDHEYYYPSITQPVRAPGSPHPGGPQPRSPNNVNNTSAGSGAGGQGKIEHDYFDPKNMPNKSGSQDDEDDDHEYYYPPIPQPVRAPGSPHPGGPQPRSPNNLNNTTAGSGAEDHRIIEHDYFSQGKVSRTVGAEESPVVPPRKRRVIKETTKDHVDNNEDGDHSYVEPKSPVPGNRNPYSHQPQIPSSPNTNKFQPRPPNDPNTAASPKPKPIKHDYFNREDFQTTSETEEKPVSSPRVKQAGKKSERSHLEYFEPLFPKTLKT